MLVSSLGWYEIALKDKPAKLKPMTLFPQSFEITSLLGDDATAIAQRVLGDATRFREVAEANDITDVLEPLAAGLGIEVPSIDSLTRAVPELGRIATTLNSVRGQAAGIKSIIADVESALGSLPLPDGYTQEALAALGEVNEALDDAFTVVDQISQARPREVLQAYAGKVRLIDWLLN